MDSRIHTLSIENDLVPNMTVLFQTFRPSGFDKNMSELKSRKEDGEGGRIWKVAKERIFIQLFEHFIKLKSYKRLLKYKF